MKFITRLSGTFLLTFGLLLFISNGSIAQNVGINKTGAAPNASSLLDISSTTSGLLVPRMTTAQMNAIAAPALSLVIYNTTVNCFEFWTGSIWVTMTCICISPTPGSISGNSTPSTNSSGNIYSIAAVPGASGYMWTIAPAGSTITAGQGTPSITVSFGPLVQTYTICVYDSSLTCAKSSTSCTTVTTANCGLITLDPLSGVVTYVDYPSNLPTMTLNISTSSPNELVLVTITGCCPGYSGVPTMTNASAAVPIVNFYGNQASDATFGFIPTALGAHTVSAPAGTYPNYEQMYAAAFIGFCGIPTIAANVTPYPITLGTAPSGYGAAPATITTNITTPFASSYVYGIFDNSLGGSKPAGVITWVGATNLATTYDGSYGWDMSAGGIQEPAATNYTISCTDTQSDWSGNATLLDLYCIHK